MVAAFGLPMPKLIRVINGGSNFGCLPPQQHFGLGTLEHADSLEVWWPSGLREQFDAVPANTRIFITEGEGKWTQDKTERRN